jgi:hypothetical protein
MGSKSPGHLWISPSDTGLPASPCLASLSSEALGMGNWEKIIHCIVILMLVQ